MFKNVRGYTPMSRKKKDQPNSNQSDGSIQDSDRPANLKFPSPRQRGWTEKLSYPNI